MTQKPLIPLAAAPPQRVLALLRERLSEREFQAYMAVMALRGAAQQIDNAVTEWMSNSVGNISRFQIMAFVWASGEAGAAHKEIVTAAGVSRATISGIMAGLEKDGLVSSIVDEGDRRSMIARLTPVGVEAMERALQSNADRVQVAFKGMASEELIALGGQLQRVRDGFAGVGKPGGPKR